MKVNFIDETFEKLSDWLVAVCYDYNFVSLISVCGLLLFKLHCILRNYEMFYH